MNEYQTLSLEVHGQVHFLAAKRFGGTKLCFDANGTLMEEEDVFNDLSIIGQLIFDPLNSSARGS